MALHHPVIKTGKKTQKRLIVFNDDDEVLDYKMAVCCNAIPGDLIFWVFNSC